MTPAASRVKGVVAASRQLENNETKGGSQRASGELEMFVVASAAFINDEAGDEAKSPASLQGPTTSGFRA